VPEARFIHQQAKTKAKHQGTVVVYAEVEPSGRAVNLSIMRSLGLGLDKEALEAIQKWRFRPGYEDGKPVTVAATHRGQLSPAVASPVALDVQRFTGAGERISVA
jgi:TonB family protein